MQAQGSGENAPPQRNSSADITEAHRYPHRKTDRLMFGYLGEHVGIPFLYLQDVFDVPGPAKSIQ